jgi:hypothetical protein
MSLRHAAALALVGWYLMVPPLNSPSDPIAHVPLSKWTVQERFDSKLDCQLGHFRTIDTAQKQNANDYPFLLTIAEAECIEGDDPRLKGN